MPGPLYRLPDSELSQGDIIDGVPHICLAGPLEIIRKVTLPGDRVAWAPYSYPPVAGKTPNAPGPRKTVIQAPFHVKEGEHLPAFARFTRAILLNHDCDLVEHDPAHPERPPPDHCLVAIVRPLSGVHEQDQPIIRANQNFSYFYLPADEELQLEEGYADFRQVTCLEPALIRTIGVRRAALSPLGVTALQAQLFRFLTRRDLNAPIPAAGPPPAGTPSEPG